MPIFRDNETGRYVDETGRDVTEAYSQNPVQSFLYGAGNIGHNIAERVIPQGIAEATGLGLPLSQENRQFMTDVEATNPIAFGAGELATQAIGPTKGGPIVQGLYGLGQGGLTSDPGDALTGSLTGGAGGVLGDVVGRVLGKAYNVMKGVLPDTVSANSRELTRRGYRQTPAQKTGSQGRMRTELQFQNTPKGQMATSEIGDHNMDVLTSRANEAIGLPADAGPLTRNSFQAAADLFAETTDPIFDAAADVPVGESFIKRVNRLGRNVDLLDLPELDNGLTVLSGRDLKGIREQLRLARLSNDGLVQNAATELTDDLDDLILESIGGEAKQTYRLARERYKNLIALEKGRAVSSDGVINPVTLRNNLEAKTGYGRRSVENTLDATRKMIEDVELLTGKNSSAWIGDPNTGEKLANSWFDIPDILKNEAAGSYYQGGITMPNMMADSPKIFPAVGGNVGRAGLLGIGDEQ